MDLTALMVFLSVCSSGLWAEHTAVVPDVRLVDGTSSCDGKLEMKDQGDWSEVTDWNLDWTLTSAAEVCKQLDCGSVVSLRRSYVDYVFITCSGLQLNRNHEFPLTSCSTSSLCSDSVRLVNGTGLCSGRLEVRSDQLNRSWSSVSEDGFDQKDAVVVCRELRCGPPSVLQGALFGEPEAPTWSRRFQCEGTESALLDCDSSVRKGSGKAVGLTCSEPVDSIRLVGGGSQCKGRLEIKHRDEWKEVSGVRSLSFAGEVCKQLDCGSPVSLRYKGLSSVAEVWELNSDCDGSSLTKCVTWTTFSSDSTEVTCSDSVRLVNGTGLCSGRLEVRSDQLNRSWSSVGEDGFDQKDAEVVCRELACGPPSVLQGALFGEPEAPTWSRRFQCEGTESALLDCDGSVRKYSGEAVGLTCSEPVDSIRLIGGGSRCNGTLELKHREERKGVKSRPLTLSFAGEVCKQVDCGSPVSIRTKDLNSVTEVWELNSDCDGSSLSKCVTWTRYSSDSTEVTCSDSVRLVNGTSLCSGRLEVNFNQSWSSVCEADFDQRVAEVVCRELECGPPSVLQGVLYGEPETPVWSRKLQCEGTESALLDCRQDSARNTCSSDKAVGLTCSDGIRLVGGASHCAGTLEMFHQKQWRPVDVLGDQWNQNLAAAVCAQQGCGSVVSTGRSEESSGRLVWRISSACLQRKSSLRDCSYVVVFNSNKNLEVICSGFLTDLIIRVIVVLLGLMGSTLVLYFYFKASSSQKSRHEKRHCVDGSRAEGCKEEETVAFRSE